MSATDKHDGDMGQHGMTAAVRSGVTARYQGRDTQRMRIRPQGHLGTARWGRRFPRIRGLFAQLERIARITLQPREFHVEKHNPVAPAIKAGITLTVLLVVIRLWRRRENRQ